MLNPAPRAAHPPAAGGRACQRPAGHDVTPPPRPPRCRGSRRRLPADPLTQCAARTNVTSDRAGKVALNDPWLTGTGGCAAVSWAVSVT